MQYDRMLAELFSEEDRARDMATRLADIARTSREAAAAERESLLAFLTGPIERHFAYEEQVIFPELVDHGLGEEVQVATKQHDAVRQLARNLSEAGPTDDLGALVFDIARLLLHHTNFEGDYIYPELTHDEWRELMKETVTANAPATLVDARDALPPAASLGAIPAEGSVLTGTSVSS
jgi:hemerythrin-like domain-containing protein